MRLHGYDGGYEAGYDDGYEAGYEAGYEGRGNALIESSENITMVLENVESDFVGVMLHFWYCSFSSVSVWKPW